MALKDKGKEKIEMTKDEFKKRYSDFIKVIERNREEKESARLDSESMNFSYGGSAND